MPTDADSRTMSVDTASGLLTWGGRAYPCAIGKAGALPAADKREGDKATPLGQYPLRWVYARPDRIPHVETRLEVRWLSPADGWCDDPSDPAYNRPVSLPYAASAEHLWRDDGLYDLIVVLGHNDDPVTPGAGSAIFLHCCAFDGQGAMKPTLGCIALPKADLLEILASCGGLPGDIALGIT
jgi:L,D-peptidoglycan transpeptidase YkuD (ErfK/YbiS/YcfS/YnhG family)